LPASRASDLRWRSSDRACLHLQDNQPTVRTHTAVTAQGQLSALGRQAGTRPKIARL
jgi:hypothetical protein